MSGVGVPELGRLCSRRVGKGEARRAATSIGTVREDICDMQEFDSRAVEATRCLGKRPNQRYSLHASILRHLAHCRLLLGIVVVAVSSQASSSVSG